MPYDYSAHLFEYGNWKEALDREARLFIYSENSYYLYIFNDFLGMKEKIYGPVIMSRKGKANNSAGKKLTTPKRKSEKEE